MDENFLMSLLGGGQPASPSLPPPLDLSGLEPWMQMRLAPPSNNVMQAAAAPQDMPQPAPVAEAPAEAPRQRRSLLDTVGRISDVLATVGGAPALYQPTLDAREDREFLQGERQRGVDLAGLQRTLTQQQIDAGEDAATGRENVMLGQAVRGLQAIAANNGDVAAAWPILARQAGIPEDRAAALGQIFASNPQNIGAFASMLGQQTEFGMQPFYAQDGQGNLTAYQLGRDGTVRPIRLGDGETPIDPLRFVDTGGSQVGVGTRSGTVRRILPNSVSPDVAAGNQSRERIAAAGNASRERTAQIREQGSASTGGNTAAMVEAARANLLDLRQIYTRLNEMGAMVSPGRSTGNNLAARARASGAGQLLEGALGTEAQSLRDQIASIRPALMQSIAQATGMTGRQLDSNADVRLFMQTVTNPASSYEANINAIARLERFIAANARRAAPADAPSAPARQPQRRQPQRRQPQRRVNPNGGWGRATVVR